MNDHIEFSLPFRDPVIVFTFILVIFLFFPLFSRRLKIPGIIGLIIAGIVAGPHGFNLIPKEIGIVLFGTVGLQYLMFLAGLEINLNDFKRYKLHSIVFGAFTFFIPLFLAYVLTRFIFKMPFLPALLFSSILSTHTLISYPIVSRYGLVNRKITGITIGGTIITDTGVLVLLTIISSASRGSLDWFFGIKFLFLLVIFYVLPWAGKWLLKHLQGDGGYQYISVLLLVFASAFFAKLAGVEPIIGSFFAGLFLNRLIPRTSPLMNRIVFIGNNLFIPFFLVSVGMLLDLSVMFSGMETVYFSLLVVVFALLSKYFAAYFTQKIFKYSRNERNLMFGLSSSHAAATIAVILVGYELGLFNEKIMNTGIFLIFVSCLFSSFVTDKYARKLSCEKQGREKSGVPPERILVPLSNPGNLEYLMDFSVAIKPDSSKDPIYPLTVIPEDEDTPRKINEFHRGLDKYHMEAASTENAIQPLIRIDVSVVDGILRAAKEISASKIIIGWNGKVSASHYILGTLLDNLVQKASQMLMVIKINKPLEQFGSIKVFISPESEYEPGYEDWLNTVLVLSERVKKPLEFYGNNNTLVDIEQVLTAKSYNLNGITFNVFDGWKSLYRLPAKLSVSDLIFVVAAKTQTISYHPYIESIPRVLTRFFKNLYFVLVYPSNFDIPDDSLSTRLGS